jgi:hypothetical protein
MQVIVPSVALEMPLRDLQGMPEDQLEEEALRLATEEARQPFDLTAAPLLRALLLRLRADDYVLTVTIHHIVSDGWSLGVLRNCPPTMRARESPVTRALSITSSCHLT